MEIASSDAESTCRRLISVNSPDSVGRAQAETDTNPRVARERDAKSSPSGASLIFKRSSSVFGQSETAPRRRVRRKRLRVAASHEQLLTKAVLLLLTGVKGNPRLPRVTGTVGAS
jgi:hypothetical protein